MSYGHEEIRKFSEYGNFSVATSEILYSNMVLSLSTISMLISHCLWVDPKYTWSRNDVHSPKSTSLFSTFHIGSIFCFFPAHLMSSTYTDKNNPYSRCTNKHSQLETFSQPYFIRIYQIAFPITVLPKDDHRDFVQEERLGLPYWTMILAICVVVDESKCLDIPIWEFSISLEHLPFLPGYEQILRQLLVLRTLAIWIWYPWFFAAVMCDADDPCSVNTA